MAVDDFGKALKYTNKSLERLGVAREELWMFWKDHCPDGKDQADRGAFEGVSPSSVYDDHFFLTRLLAGPGGVQDFLFSDSGDKAANVPPQPATSDEMDGKYGPMTDTRRLTYLQSLRKPEPGPVDLPTGTDEFVFGKQRIQVPGVNIISFDEQGAFSFYDKTKKGYYKWPAPVDDMISTKKTYLLNVTHWDATFSCKHGFSVLVNRGYASTYGVDNDGTVYQWLDPGRHYGAHAGSTANRAALTSTDLTNAVYLKYQNWYEKNVGKSRPVIKAIVHGTKRRQSLLGYYKAQVVAHLRVLKAIAAAKGFPLVFPAKDHKPIYTVYQELFSKKYRGACTHLHITRKKWDCSAWEDSVAVVLLTDQALFEEFPSLVECYRLHDQGWAAWMDDLRTVHGWKWDEVWS